MWENGDAASEPLFTYVDPCVFERRTYKLFFDLLDNYERGVSFSLDLNNDIYSRIMLTLCIDLLDWHS